MRKLKLKLKLKLKINNLQNKLFEYLFEKILDQKIKSEFIPRNYIYFKNTYEINNWGKEFNFFFKLQKERIGNLKSTKEEKYEIETYKYYAGYGSINMNNLLRGKEIIFPESVKDRIEDLSKSISKFRPKDNLIVIRRFPKSEFNPKLKKGDSYIEKGFLSTYLDLSCRLDYDGGYRPIKNEILMLLKVPKETNACYIKEISDKEEYELIIQKAKKIRIDKNIRVFNNKIVIGEIIN